MVNHDVTHGVTTKRVFTIGHQRLTTTETHVADNDVVSVNLERLSCYADTIARSRLSGNRDIGCTNIDG